MTTRYLRLLRYEFKNIVRDQMTMVMLVYPLLILMIGSYVLPELLSRFGEGDAGQYVASLVVILILGSLAPFIGGAMFGFLMLDHRDENTLDSLRVTPMSLKGYLGFKATYTYLLAVLASFVVLYGVRVLSGDRYTVMGMNVLSGFTFVNVFLYALVAGFLAPIFGLLLASLGKNKIEGFAYMKTLGILAILPALVAWEAMQDARQYLLGFMPTFWPLKGLMVDANLLQNDANLPFGLYLLIGLMYSLLLGFFLTRLFYKKIQQ